MMHRLADATDAVLEATVVPSFTSIGSVVRRRLDHWRPIDGYDMTDQVVLVTGATSGLGKQTATTCARLGATVVVTGRRPDTVERAAGDIAAASGAAHGCVVPVAADMGELDDVHRLAETVSTVGDRLDVLIHNAGALTNDRRTTTAGIEATVASQVVGPFLLTHLLLDRLHGSTPGRVVTVSSGGMYAARLSVRDLQMSDADYSGSDQYARAKRAQVTLNEMWAQRVDATDVVFAAMHPGWADTPGVQESLPRFRSITRPLLRSLDEGIDTTVWLACDDEPTARSGTFWHDRRRRSIHHLPHTRRSDTAERRARLWQWCEEAAGLPTTAGS